MKIYHLTIAYDEKTEEIEYIMESVDEDSLEIHVIGEVNLADYFDEAVDRKSTRLNSSH
jgi:hypothetical protein